MVFKCKICGGSLDVKQGEKIAVCEYCGVKQTIPSFIEPKIQEIYNRANSYLIHNEFDKAENLYNQILFDNKQDADAYWNILMCRYGVTYVKDPSSSKYIPTCNKTLYAPILNDENYQNAIKYADEKQKELYTQNAKAIDAIQKDILAISKKEKPFDIFISYKETGENGGRTKDSIVAQEWYDKLTAEGYKVFFSRITLEDKIGIEYEPYIYAALASSKVMIAIASSKENIKSVWVKNEWSRYLSFMGKADDKTLIPLYFDMDKDDLPDDFAHLSSYDMTINGFEQELIRSIKKLIPLPVMLLEKRKKRNAIFKKIGIGTVACAIIGIIISVPWFAKLPEYNEAMQMYYDKNYPEATWAFAELGSYRDSDEMKEKCELSWRKSLANVVSFETVSSGEYGAYYISKNGSVEHLSYDTRGIEDKNLKINEHGEYISIQEGYDAPMYGLHEDGYVENATDNNYLTNDWTDIIQISRKFFCTSVALKADGTMVYGDINNNYTFNGKIHTDEWLSDIQLWDSIIAFDYHIDEIEYGYFLRAAIIGIKSDGTLCGVYTDEIDHKYETEENDSEYMSRDTKGAIEISLSTCTDDSQRRLIIWAKADV